MNESLLMLDIDGVMNSTSSCLQHRSGEVFTTGACTALRLLTNRHKETKLVITSTRRRAGLVAMRHLFTRNLLGNLSDRIIGLTPILTDHDSDEFREEEITQYLEARPAWHRLLILDDKPITGPLARHWVGTDPDVGLTLKCANQASPHLRP